MSAYLKNLKMISLSKYEKTVTGRAKSFFQEDLVSNQCELEQTIGGSRILVGAAGSIGTARIKTILRFN